jgi:hypothetical protein
MLGRPRWLSSLRCQGLVFNIAAHRVLKLMRGRASWRRSWMIVPSPWRVEQVRGIRVGVAFEVLNAVSGTPSGVSGGTLQLLVSSRVCIMHTR